MCPYCGAKCENLENSAHHETKNHRLMGMRGCHKIELGNNGKGKLNLITDMYCDS